VLNKLLIKLPRLALYVLLGGLLLVGLAIYQLKAEHGGGVPAKSELSTVTGAVVDGREVSVEHKGRRGGKTTATYFELDVKAEGRAELLKVRVDGRVPKERIEPIGEAEKLTITYEPSDLNLVFDITDGKTTFLRYDEVAKLPQIGADSAAQSSVALIGVGALLVLLGAAGLFWRRTLVARQAQPVVAAA
jgi:hypothetical protein